MFVTPVVDLGLLQIKTENKQVDLVNEFDEYVNKKYTQFKHIFTDGSKRPKVVTQAAVPSQKSEMCRRTSDNLSVYAVEMLAILMAIESIDQNKVNRALICRWLAIITFLYIVYLFKNKK